MAKMAILNYTTEVPVEKTVSQIETLLQKHGASAIVKTFDAGKITALEFDINTEVGIRSIRLPANVPAIFKILKGDYWVNEDKEKRLQAQAARVAWRIVLRWVEAQLALIQTEMVSLDQVFLPYILVASGQTMYQALLGRQLQLPPGGGDQPSTTVS